MLYGISFLEGEWGCIFWLKGRVSPSDHPPHDSKVIQTFVIFSYVGLKGIGHGPTMIRREKVNSTFM